MFGILICLRWIFWGWEVMFGGLLQAFQIVFNTVLIVFVEVFRGCLGDFAKFDVFQIVLFHTIQQSCFLFGSCFLGGTTPGRWRRCSASFASLSAIVYFVFFGGPRFQNWDLRIRPLGGNFKDNLMFRSKILNSSVQGSKIRKMDPSNFEKKNIFIFLFRDILT